MKNYNKTNVPQKKGQPRKRTIAYIGIIIGFIAILIAMLMWVLGFPTSGLGPRKLFLALSGVVILCLSLLLLIVRIDSLQRVFRKLISKFWNSQWIFNNLLVPFTVLSLYCLIFVVISIILGLEGVNFHFSVALGILHAMLLLLTVIVFLFLWFASKRNNQVPALKNSRTKFLISDLILIILPLTPIFQYIWMNREILTIIDSGIIVLFFIVFAGLFILLIPYSASFFGSLKVMKCYGLAFISTIAFMAFFSRSFSWFETGNIGIQLAIFYGIFLVSLILSGLKDKWILYVTIIIFFLFNCASQFLSKPANAADVTSNYADNDLLLAVSGDPQRTPSVYLLVYDSYVSNETLLAQGIDNSAQEQLLSSLGFQLYPHTYTVAANTIASMSRVFNASDDYYGNPRKGISGDGIVQNIFGSLGYDTYGIFPNSYIFRGIGSSYDYSFPKTMSHSYIQLSTAILLGEFRFNFNFADPTHEQYVEEKIDILNDSAGKRVFLYSHSDLPAHAQDSGVCLSDEIDRFEERLQEANQEMITDISIILEKDPEAIIIIAGDHGPTLTKDCSATLEEFDAMEITRLDLQDRFGVFLAIKWPTDDYAAYDQITILQDVFPTIFAYMYEDPDLLNTRIPPVVTENNQINGISINDGIIQGGINTGQPLFLLPEE